MESVKPPGVDSPSPMFHESYQNVVVSGVVGTVVVGGSVVGTVVVGGNVVVVLNLKHCRRC